MTETESVVPKLKRKQKRDINIPILNIILVFFCVFILILSTFIQIKIHHPILSLDIFSNKALTRSDFFYTYTLIPQIPAVLFVVGLLERKLSITSIIIYILIGLFVYPVFALGGGLEYVGEHGFGYILAYIPAAYCAGSILKSEFSVLNIFKAALVGVFVVHFIGIFYMLIIALIRHESLSFIKGWIFSQSILKFAYDYIFSLFGLSVAKYINKYVKYLIS